MNWLQLESNNVDHSDFRPKMGLHRSFADQPRRNGFEAQADRAATNGGTLEARRAGTSTAA